MITILTMLLANLYLGESGIYIGSFFALLLIDIAVSQALLIFLLVRMLS